VTTQPFGEDRLAARGWLLPPRVNRLTMFDGRVLHGVIPGRGLSPAPQVGLLRRSGCLRLWCIFQG
jgi:hypothetical protein